MAGTGMKTGPKGPFISEEQLIARIQEYARVLGETPSASRMNQDRVHMPNIPSTSTLQRRFGSFNQAMIAAGLKVNPGGGRGRKAT